MDKFIGGSLSKRAPRKAPACVGGGSRLWRRHLATVSALAVTSLGLTGGAQSSQARYPTPPAADAHQGDELKARWSAARRAGLGRRQILAFGFDSPMLSRDAVLNDSSGYDTRLLRAPSLGRRFFGSDWRQIRTSDARARVPKRVIGLVRLDRSGKIDRVATIDAEYGGNLEGLPVTWLGLADNAELLEFLLGQFEQPYDAEVRAELATAIALQPQSGRVLPWLMDQSLHNSHEAIRAAAVEGLYWHTFDQRAAFLRRIAEHDAGPRVWSGAINTLGLLGADGRRELRALAAHSEDPIVGETAKERLSHP